MSASYSTVIGNTARFKNEIYVDNVLTNPTSQAWTVEEPDGTDQALTEASSATGIWTATFVPTQAGWHKVKFTATGNSADYVRERMFYVATSNMTPD